MNIIARWWFQIFLRYISIWINLGKWFNSMSKFLRWVAQPPTRFVFAKKNSSSQLPVVLSIFTWTPCHVDTRIQKISMTIGLFVWIRDQSLFGMKCWCSNEWFLHCPCNSTIFWIPTSYYRVSMQLSNCLVSWVISPTSGTELTHLEGRKQSPSSFTSNQMQWDAILFLP